MPRRFTEYFCFAALLLVATARMALAEDGPVSHRIEIKGVKIHYLVAGKGEPVVLIHGLDSSATINWRLPGIMAELARDHQVIALDLPGHGQSDKPDDPAAYGRQMVDDVLAVMDQEKAAKAHIVGYSLGGMIAMKLTVVHPDRVLSETQGGWGWLRDGSALQKLWEKIPARGLGPPQAFYKVVGDLAVTEEEVRKISVPMKILVGDRDPVKEMYVVPLEKARPDVPVVEIKDAGHISCVTKSQFREELASWIRKNTK